MSRSEFQRKNETGDWGHEKSFLILELFFFFKSRSFWLLTITNRNQLVFIIWNNSSRPSFALSLRLIRLQVSLISHSYFSQSKTFAKKSAPLFYTCEWRIQWIKASYEIKLTLFTSNQRNIFIDLCLFLFIYFFVTLKQIVRSFGKLRLLVIFWTTVWIFYNCLEA